MNHDEINLDADRIDFENQCNKGLTEFPIEICNRTNIRWIHLDNNQISNLPMELVNLKKLFWLTISNNRLEEIPIGLLIDLVKNGLRRIDLSGNPIKNIPKHLLGEDPNNHGGNLTRIIDYLLQTEDKRKKLRILNQFVNLIETNGISEPTITKFLSEHENQFILKTFFSSVRIHGQIKCKWQVQKDRKDLIPDFFIETSNGFSDIIDFKLPQTRNIVTGIANREHFSSKMSEYISQLENYRDYFDETDNRDWVLRKYNIKVFKPRITLIIGRRHDFTNFEWKKLESRFSNLQIINYDDIIDFASYAMNIL